MTLKWSIERRTSDLGTRVPEFQPLKYISYQPMIQPILLRILLPQNRRLWPACLYKQQLAKCSTCTFMARFIAFAKSSESTFAACNAATRDWWKFTWSEENQGDKPKRRITILRRTWISSSSNEKRNDHMTHASWNWALFALFLIPFALLFRTKSPFFVAFFHFILAFLLT